ncbi:hypothetical protein C8R45DRAFT_933918 [Mycena sanguinolenta]|nr:hypothetical protein C8R45DRAFT_933918 [Mycena sanguinolenta]
MAAYVRHFELYLVQICAIGEIFRQTPVQYPSAIMPEVIPSFVSERGALAFHSFRLPGPHHQLARATLRRIEIIFYLTKSQEGWKLRTPLVANLWLAPRGLQNIQSGGVFLPALNLRSSNTLPSSKLGRVANSAAVGNQWSINLISQYRCSRAESVKPGEADWFRIMQLENPLASLWTSSMHKISVLPVCGRQNIQLDGTGGRFAVP